MLDGDSSFDPNFVAPGDIPWLKVTVVGHQNGPTGGDKLVMITHPAADYYFYKYGSNQDFS